MIREPFAVGDSPIHRIDPRVRVFFAVLFSVVVALSYRFPALTAALFLSLFLTAAARLPFRAVLRRMAVVWGFLIFLWLILPLTFGGEAIYRLGPLVFSRPGVALAGQITLKSHAIPLALIALVATMNSATLGYVLDYFRLPRKLVHLLLLTYRYIFVIEQEYLSLARAARLRCFRPRTNLHTYRTYAYLVGMLFVRASARADRVYKAMQCRGFQGKIYCLRSFAVTPLDWVWTGLLTAWLLCLAILEWSPASIPFN